jgi:hypothetical protein
MARAQSSGAIMKLRAWSLNRYAKHAVASAAV